MKSATAGVALVGVMLAGAFGIHHIWEWFSLVSEGRAAEASPQPLVLSLLLLALCIGAAAKIADWITDSQPHGGQ